MFLSILFSILLSAVQKPTVVVELYTSELCPNCPVAESYLKELKKDRQIIPLAFHVDYFDSPDKSDPYAKAAFGTRQMRYIEKFGLDAAYTPEIVVNGMHEFVGSTNRESMDDYIHETLKHHNKANVVLEVKKINESMVEVAYKVSGKIDKDAVLRVALVEKSVKDQKSREMINVVREFTTVFKAIPEDKSPLSNGTLQMTLPSSAFEKYSVIGFIQDSSLEISGSAVYDLSWTVATTHPVQPG